MPDDGEAPSGVPLLIDARGERCPMPVVRTKRAMRGEGANLGIVLLVDDEEALQDIPALLKRHGWPEAALEEEGTVWRFTITPPSPA